MSAGLDDNLFLLGGVKGEPGAPMVPVIDFDSATLPLDNIYEPTVPIPFLIDRIMPEGEITGLAGPGKVGKSLLALQIGVHVALGAEWCGMQVAYRHVVYLSAEDQTDVLENRLKAYMQRMEKLTGASDKTFFGGKGRRGKRIAWLKAALRIVNMRGLGWTMTKQERGGSTINADHIAQVVRWVQRQFPAGAKPLLIVDTAGRFDEGAETNADYKAFVGALDLLQRELGCTMLMLAHTSQQATLDKRLDLTAMRGGLHLGNSIRSMLIIAGHRLGYRDDQLEVQGVIPPKEADLQGDFFKATDVEGVRRENRLSVLVHTDSNVGPTQRPIWFIRGGYMGAGIMTELRFTPDLEGRKQARAEAKRVKDAEKRAARDAKDQQLVLEYIGREQGNPKLVLTTKALADGRGDDKLLDISKDRVRAALDALAKHGAIEAQTVTDPRRKGSEVDVWQAAEE